MRNVEKRFGYRSAKLYDEIVGAVAEAGEDGLDWIELLARADPRNEWAERTVEGAIRDLTVLGMLSVGGKPGTLQRPNTRRAWLSPLGAAALEGRPYVLPWASELGS